MGKSFCKVEHKWCKFCHRKTECKFISKYHPVDLKTIHKCPKREINETISFRELLYQVSFADVYKKIIHYWPNESKNYQGYKQLYTTLLTIKGKKSNYFIDCNIMYFDDWTDDGKRIPNAKCCPDAFAKLLNKHTTYALDFIDWSEVVTMNITETALNELQKAVICAGVFYEITFHGFNQNKIKNTWNDIVNNFNEMK